MLKKWLPKILLGCLGLVGTLLLAVMVAGLLDVLWNGGRFYLSHDVYCQRPTPPAGMCRESLYLKNSILYREYKIMIIEKDEDLINYIREQETAEFRKGVFILWLLITVPLLLGARGRKQQEPKTEEQLYEENSRAAHARYVARLKAERKREDETHE